MMIFKKRVLWFADTTVNIEPNAEELADIAIQTAELAQEFHGSKSLESRCFRFSNFGSNAHPPPERCAKPRRLSNAVPQT